MVRLVAKEVLPSVPEEQSHTLMIEGVLGEFAPEVKAIEARNIEEEEGSSSNPGKDDNEVNDANDEYQINNASDQQVGVQHKEQASI